MTWVPFTMAPCAFPDLILITEASDAIPIGVMKKERCANVK